MLDLNLDGLLWFGAFFLAVGVFAAAVSLLAERERRSAGRNGE